MHYVETLRPVLSVRLHTDEKCFGPGVAELLLRVERLHSLRAAAASMNMAYSKAWRIIRDSEKLLGFNLLLSTTGGKNGGGAQLTAEAQTLLSDYSAFVADVRSAAQALFQERFRKED